MADEDEWKKLPTEEKVQHKSWKARAEGYQECIKKFPKFDEKSSEFSKYLGLVKKFVIDSNELNRIQGLQATLLFVENASVAGKTCSEVLSGMISKCFNSKPRLREIGMDLCLMYVEIDKNELFREEIMKGFENKQPKIVHACVEVIKLALKLFGSKVISVKPLIKPTIKLLDHRDKNVRESAKSLFVEMYRWIGPAIRAPLQSINGVVLKELEDEWEKLGPGAQAKQTRFMRSQQDLREKMEAKAAAEEDDNAGGNEEVAEVAAVDPYDFLEPVEILSKLPKNFFSQIEEKKWQERKMALEACEKLVTENPKLAPADDYADLVKALKKVLSKDTNILLVVIAIKCIGALAKGLRKKFQPYALVCLDGMFERFKEKKANVVAALQEAVDSIYLTTSIQAISETVVEALAHKNPSIRSQVGLFLARALAKTKAAAVNKALMKLFVQSLCKNMDHGTPDVREAAFQATGMMLKLVGESKLHPFLADLDKFKMDKINESSGKAEVKAPKGASSASSSQPKSTTSSKESRPKTSSSKTVEKKESKENSQKSAKTVKKKTKSSSGASSSSSAAPPTEAELNDEVAEELVLKVISEEEKKQVVHSNWKERLAGLQACSQKLKILERSEIPAQAFVKLLTMKPGWKDTNFNCLIERFKLLSFLAENGTFSRTSAGFCLIPAVDKIGDVKCGSSSKEALTSMSEATGMPWVAEQVLEHSMSQKNPKIQSESINWLSQVIRDFGISGLNVKLVIEKVKLAVSATNPAVRTSAFSLIGTLALFLGEKMRMFFESEKSTILQQIDAEMEKVKGQSPPAPCRGAKKQSSGSGGGADEGEEEEEEQGGGISLDDMVTRVDISVKITDDLIGKLNDKNWKIRKEGLDTVVEILNEAKFVSASIGDLPSALKGRLSDSNKLLVTLTLNILIQLSTSLGPHSAKHVSFLSPYIVNALGDSKPQVRQTALKCMNTWVENSKLSLWLEGDNMAAALSKPKQTFLRIELLNWLSEKLSAAKKLPSNARESLELCAPVLYSCCEDRSGDVRAKAQAAIPAFMQHLSYEKMLRSTGKLSAGSKGTIIPLLDKAREQLPPPPSKSAKSSSSSAPKKKAEEPVVSETVEKSSAPSAKERKTSSKKEDTRKRAPSSQRKQKSSEEDSSPTFISLPNGKEQRMKDEAKLKLIKWNFTTPRDELVTQLQQQFGTCAGSALMTALFHADFQQHLKAIAMLQQALSSDWKNTVGSLDVILRWFTLRFYDKNTTVHLKSLEYLKSLFDLLIKDDYRMSEYEASAFLPHLMIKIGESKDNIRKAIHGILKQVALVYASSKLFNYVMDGIKSKNSRQRSESLDHIGMLIEEFGINVCQPSAPKALKEIATNISDRDKSVRSSALNAIVAAYNVSGEIVYKQVGRLNEKDMSMLEERIKRSGKFVEGGAARAPEPTNQIHASNATKSIKETKSVPSNMAKTPANIEKSQSAPEKINNHIQSTRSRVEEEESLIPDEIVRGIAQLQEINVDHLLKPLPMPDFIKDREQGEMSSTAASAIDVSIAQIASTNLDSSIEAIHALYVVLRHQEKLPHLKQRMDQLLTSSTTLVRMTTDRYLPVVAANSSDGNVNPDNFRTLCKSHFAFLLDLFSCHELCSHFSSYTIYDFLRFVMPLMVNELFVKLPYSSKLTKIMNLLVLRLLDHCDPTAVTCASIKLLTDSLESGSASYYGIAIKCLWKLGRSISELLNPQKHDEFRHQPLKIASLVAEIDRLWSTYPRGHAIYTRVGGDMPLRSLKTILLNLCKEPGVQMMDELHMINNPEHSDVVSVIRKAVGSSAKIPHRSFAHTKENIASPPGMSPDMKLSGIFKKIGDRQLTKQGLLELYDFKQEHPQYDVDSHIEGLEVEFFRDYVKRGLKKIEDERLSKGVSQIRPVTSHPTSYQPDKEHFARLNRLRANCGLEPLNKEEMSKRFGSGSRTSSDLSATSNNKVLTPTTNTLHRTDPSYRVKTAPQQSRGAPHPSGGPVGATTTSSSLLDIKRRLEQIKQSAARR